jgi:hypothetical protein
VNPLLLYVCCLEGGLTFFGPAKGLGKVEDTLPTPTPLDLFQGQHILGIAAAVLSSFAWTASGTSQSYSTALFSLARF